MSLLGRILAPRQFHLTPFDPAPLEFEPEPLLLEAVVGQASPTNVVAFPQGIPTAGELHARIERHLCGKSTAPSGEPVSPADELREALAELRRSLG
jgi:hypothetical protein